MRMRTLPQAAEILKREDPGTAITLTALRRMVKQGKIPVSMQGNKPLMDVDKLPEYMYASLSHSSPPPALGAVRPRHTRILSSGRYSGQKEREQCRASRDI